ncbi:hypothetical protein B0H19DRAFT_1075964 [Mycena capillaripes]|nr:hypothetical protein B0H19DRAFT_1075964 [Mycena capillaripes]
MLSYIFLAENYIDYSRYITPCQAIPPITATYTYWPFSDGYAAKLYSLIQDIQHTVKAQREEARLRKNAKQRAARQAKKGVYESESDAEEEQSEEDASTDEQVEEHA